jgi:hypothetical protein
MPNDPGLAADGCIFLEAIPGDGGVHPATGWWLSPDIELTGPTSGPDKADPGMANTVKVRVHQKDKSCSLPTGTGAILIELYVGNPSLVMKPNDACSTRLISTVAATGLPAPGTSPQTTITWTPPVSPAPPTGCTSHPENPGHKCLIARCYPDTLSPDPAQFYLPDDQHYAQRNVCIVPCEGGGGEMGAAARAANGCTFNVSTANLSDEQPAAATIQVIADLQPTQHVLEALTPGLRRVPGFKRVSTQPPQGFNLRLPDFPDAIVRDDTRIGCLGRLLSFLFPPLRRKFQPKYEADIKLKPKQFATFTFASDLSGSQRGDAHIFHLMQIGSDQRVQGGLTLAMVVV